MTKLTYNLMLILFIGLSISLQAAEPTFKKEFTREVHESFDVSLGASLGIQNKHGNISISTWDKNKIQIDVLIKVKANNAEKGQNLLNAIKVDFSSSSSKVSATTIFPDEENTSWWSGWFNKKENLDYEVHYTIQAPEQISTTLINKYGNIVQETIDGDSEVTNKYGDISYKNVSGDLDLNLSYGKATIGEIGNSKMQIKFGSLKILSVQALEITTKHSDVKIKQCKRMVSDTKYDDYVIGSLGTLKNSGKHDDFTIESIDVIDIDTKYTDINIKSLKHKANFETRNGNVDIESTANGLEKIIIESKYTGYNFSIDGDFHLNFEGSHTDLHMKQPYEKYQSEKDDSELKIMAYRGSKEGGAMISAHMRYGGLDID
jgi:hypothetical protein